MKKLLRLLFVLVIVFLLVRLCTSQMGSVIKLPGGMGGSSSSSESGGWLSPKDNGSDKDLKDIVSEIENELGIGKDKKETTSTAPSNTVPSATPTTPLTFKGIPITGTLSAFGDELVKAGFRNSGSGSYVGDFAGYSGCKVTPSGYNSVQEVRVDFPVITDWNALEKSYDNLQASLTQKYGIEPKTTPGSNLAVYDLPNGRISLDADVKEQATWHVILKYTASLIGSTSTSGRNPIDDL